VWQYTANDVASAYTWATPGDPPQPSATWTSGLAHQVAATWPPVAGGWNW
jgi:hypothetical protein